MEEIKIQPAEIEENLRRIISCRVRSEIWAIINEALPPTLLSDDQRKNIKDLIARVFNSSGIVLNSSNNISE